MNKQHPTPLFVILALLATAPFSNAQAQQPSEEQLAKILKRFPEAAQPLVIPDHVTLEKDIVYLVAGDYEVALDIAVPKGLTKPVPAVVHIHGGGFWGGSKSARHAVRYAEAGFIGVSINYRLSGVAPFPAAVQDCKAAIRWLRGGDSGDVGWRSLPRRLWRHADQYFTPQVPGERGDFRIFE